MLDAFIIDRIEKERDPARRRDRDDRVPLHIESPTPPPERERSDRPSEDRDRGTAVIDFRLSGRHP